MGLPDGGEAAASEAAGDVRAALNQHYPGVRIDSVETVSGKVSEELVQSGALALLFAMIGVSIYIWFRFEWQFGVGALFSLFHDVTITLGFFALTQMEFDLNVVAALLTLIGTLGLVRLSSFYARIHAPTLGTSWGTAGSGGKREEDRGARETIGSGARDGAGSL